MTNIKPKVLSAAIALIITYIIIIIVSHRNGAVRDAPENYTITVYENGKITYRFDVGTNDVLYQRLTIYVVDSKTDDGSLAFVNVAPGLIIACKSLIVNILPNDVFVTSIGDDGKAKYERVRRKTAADRQLEMEIRHNLSTRPGHKQ